MPDPRGLLSGASGSAAGRWFARYRPFLLTALAIALIAVFLPGREPGPEEADEATALTGSLGEQAAGADDAVEGEDTSGTGSPTEAGAGEVARRTADRVADTARTAVPQGAKLVANCDRALGRIKIPSFTAPACVQAFSGRNTGADYQGVTANTIRIAVYVIQEDPTTDAILAAAGANDSPEQVKAQYRDWVTLFSKHYNTWGRKIELRFFDASAEATNDAAAKSDAIRIAAWKPFIVLNAPSNVFVDEIVARKILCACTVSQPNEAYHKWAPYVWSTLMSSTQGYVHRAEYIGKRLAGRNARWAYDEINPTQGFKGKKRVFGLLYYETTDFAYKSGIDSFVRELRKYGVTLKTRIAYNGYPDIPATQVQARPAIQRLKDAGVTSIIMAADPFGPIFFTQEATRQLYGPEWIVTGSALTDTSFFARTYDQDQWSHAFGVSFLTARLPERLSDSYNLLHWHFGRPPSAPAGYGVIRSPVDVAMRGIHHAGATLNPQTFKRGLFSAPPVGRGKLTVQTQSFGRHFWAKDDYLQYDDVTEVWWDRSARGEDEIGANGNGLYRYVLGGKRYLPGEHPRTEPRAFSTGGTSTIYSSYPKGNKPPSYPKP